MNKPRVNLKGTLKEQIEVPTSASNSAGGLLTAEKMSLPRKIAFLLIALDGGVELKVSSGHTLVLADNDEPGFAMWDGHGNRKNELFQVGSDTAYMMLVDLAKHITDKELDDLADQTKPPSARMTGDSYEW